jgi:hypothetical protein
MEMDTFNLIHNIDIGSMDVFKGVCSQFYFKISPN